MTSKLSTIFQSLLCYKSGLEVLHQFCDIRVRSTLCIYIEPHLFSRVDSEYILTSSLFHKDRKNNYLAEFYKNYGECKAYFRKAYYKNSYLGFCYPYYKGCNGTKSGLEICTNLVASGFAVPYLTIFSPVFGVLLGEYIIDLLFSVQKNFLAEICIKCGKCKAYFKKAYDKKTYF